MKERSFAVEVGAQERELLRELLTKFRVEFQILYKL